MSKAENIAQKYFHDPFITPPRVAKEKNVYHVWDDLTYAMMLSWEFEYLAAIESDRYIELYFQSGERLKNKPPSVYKDLRAQPKEMADTILRNIFSDNFNELMN